MTERLTLTELQYLIRDSLYLSLPDTLWIIAEISEIKENQAGHCYLELVEKQSADNNVRARIRANIWANRYRFIKSMFINITGESLKAGMKILFRARVEYHEIYGLSLVISDLDPSYTAGEMALKKQMIIRRLEEEGVFTMNHELDFPVVPKRIAVISSSSAAGYTDFMKHLKENDYGYIFTPVLFEATMQGEDTEMKIISALDRVAQAPCRFDVVVIIRGGGSQTDLSWFDSYKIAYHVTQFPVPVLTGIGHEKDQSVTDMVAYRSFKTPTAVAGFLIDSMVSAENMLVNLRSEITSATIGVIEENRSNINSLSIKLVPAGRLLISEKKEELSDSKISLLNNGKSFLMQAGLIPEKHRSRLISVSTGGIRSRMEILGTWKQVFARQTNNMINLQALNLNNLSSRLSILDPVNTLKRGYTMTCHDGKILKSAGETNINDKIETLFHDGSVKSVISSIKTDKLNTI